MKKFILMLFPMLARAASPYLPEPGTLRVNLSYTHDRYGSFAGAPGRTVALPGNLRQHSILPSLTYGLSKKLAVDFGTAWTHASLPTVSLNALVNSSYGLRFQAYRSERFTLAVRGAGVRSEFYPVTLAPVPSGGVFANGALGSVIAGVSLPKRAFLLAEAGYLAYGSKLPDRFLSSAFIGQRQGRWTYFGGYQETRATGGVDIANAQAAVIRFAEYRRTIGTVDLGGGYTTAGGIYLGANYSRWVTARNAPQSNGLAVTIGFRLPGRGPHW